MVVEVEVVEEEIAVVKEQRRNEKRRKLAVSFQT